MQQQLWVENWFDLLEGTKAVQLVKVAGVISDTLFLWNIRSQNLVQKL